MVAKSVHPLGRRHALRRLALPLLSVLGFHEAMAGKLTEPSGPVVLTLSGRVGLPNQGAQAVFDLAMLASFTV